LSLSLSFLAAFHIIPFAEKAERVPSADSGAAHHRSGGNRDQVAGGLQAALGKLNVSTINVGSTQNLAAELLRAMAMINVTIVPYRTTPDAMIALLRSNIQLAAEYYATTKAGIEDSKLRLLATTGGSRMISPSGPR
jgi:tripartite-type tricarboxylate transporter receptor subunit TctC